MLDRYRNRIWMAVVVALIAAIVGLAFWDNNPREKWVEQTFSHTGKMLAVTRTVEFSRASGELLEMARLAPNRFSLEFTHPENGRQISWHGEKDVHPILLDVVDGTPWLVVNSEFAYLNIAVFGCSSLPYIFLKFDSRKGRWIEQDAIEVPPTLREANLSYEWDAESMRGNPIQTPGEIAARNLSKQRSTSHYFSQLIPRTHAEWKYDGKKQNAAPGRANECRNTRHEPIDAIIPQGGQLATQPVQLEILESKDFNPDWAIKQAPDVKESLWTKYAWDEERHSACSSYIRVAEGDREHRVLGFIEDPAGKVRFIADPRLCDADAIWFLDFGIVRGRVVIVKCTPQGEILYRASFATPPEPGGYIGTIMPPTLRARDGYLYFDWWNFRTSGPDHYIKRTMKVRFREPASAAPTSIHEGNR